MSHSCRTITENLHSCIVPPFWLTLLISTNFSCCQDTFLQHCFAATGGGACSFGKLYNTVPHLPVSDQPYHRSFITSVLHTLVLYTVTSGKRIQKLSTKGRTKETGGQMKKWQHSVPELTSVGNQQKNTDSSSAYLSP